MRAVLVEGVHWNHLIWNTETFKQGLMVKTSGKIWSYGRVCRWALRPERTWLRNLPNVEMRRWRGGGRTDVVSAEVTVKRVRMILSCHPGIGHPMGSQWSSYVQPYLLAELWASDGRELCRGWTGWGVGYQKAFASYLGHVWQGGLMLHWGTGLRLIALCCPLHPCSSADIHEYCIDSSLFLWLP